MPGRATALPVEAVTLDFRDCVGKRSSVRILAYPSGHRALIPLSANGLPCPWISAYVLQLALSGTALRTQIHKVRAIKRGIMFCYASNIDFGLRCQADFLSDQELVLYIQSLRGRDGEFLTDAGTSYSSFIQFMLWLSRTVARQETISGKIRRKQFSALATLHKPCSKCYRNSPRRGLTQEQRAIFHEVIMPTHPLTPFGSMAFRNFVSLRLAYSLGLRAGELLGIKVEDLHLERSPGSVTIERRRNDPDDPRLVPSRQKTLRRELPLSLGLSQALIQLLSDRRGNPTARRHPFVFVNVKGAPLGERGYRKVLETLRKQFPKLEQVVNHVLRHDWNDRFNHMASGERKSATMERVMLDAMGWQPGSDMPTYYGVRSRKELSDRIILQMQENSEDKIENSRQ